MKNEYNNIIEKKDFDRRVYRVSQNIIDLLNRWHDKLVKERGIPLTKKQSEYLFAENIKKILDKQEIEYIRKKRKNEIIFKL